MSTVYTLFKFLHIKELREAAAAADSSEPRLSALQRRLVTLNIINVLVLLLAVWAMVFKPAL